MWDYPYVNFFENLPLSFRNHDWYRKKVESLYNKYSRSNKQLDNASQGSKAKQLAIKVLKKSRVVTRICKKLLKFLPVKKGFVAAEGRYPRKKYKSLQRLGYKSNGIGAYFLLRLLEEKVEQ